MKDYNVKNTWWWWVKCWWRGCRIHTGSNPADTDKPNQTHTHFRFFLPNPHHCHSFSANPRLPLRLIGQLKDSDASRLWMMLQFQPFKICQCLLWPALLLQCATLPRQKISQSADRGCREKENSAIEQIERNVFPPCKNQERNQTLQKGHRWVQLPPHRGVCDYWTPTAAFLLRIWPNNSATF